MSTVVQKYGGSSVADVQKLRHVAERIMRTRRQGHDVVVVVSAMGDTTDELLAMAKQVSPNPERRELDMLLTAGERISMALLSMAIRELGGDAISFTGSQSGIITNDRHVDARIIEVRPFRVQDELARGKIVVIAGYQGVSYRREITTLGRGGSDTTAVAMAAASTRSTARSARTSMASTPLTREWCPTRGASARCRTKRCRRWRRRAPRSSTRRLSSSRRRKASRSTRVPRTGPCLGADPSADGTVVRRNPPRLPGTVIGVASERDVLVLEAQADPHDLLAALDECHVAGKQLHVSTTAAHTTLVISRDNLHDQDRVTLALKSQFGDRIELVDGLGAVSAIGAGINATYANIRTGLAALDDAGIAARGMSTSSFRVTWMVPDDQVVAAVRALHACFIAASASPVP